MSCYYCNYCGQHKDADYDSCYEDPMGRLYEPVRYDLMCEDCNVEFYGDPETGEEVTENVKAVLADIYKNQQCLEPVTPEKIYEIAENTSSK